jgi:hypothetical protein
MGYVPAFCCACAGPIDHGYGLEGALEDAAEAAAGQSGTPTAADAQLWALPLDELRWLEALRVLLSPHGEKDGGTSGTLAYEDYGVVETADGDSVALNPIAWTEVEGCRPGVACHSDCLVLLQQRLASLDPPVTSSQFAATYCRVVDAHWKDLQQKQQQRRQQQQEEDDDDDDEARESLLLNALLPGVDYGQGVLNKCDQFYEFVPGAEWLVVSPSAMGDSDATRNRERIEGVITQVLGNLWPE